MNLHAPIKNIMCTDLLTLNEKDNLLRVAEIFGDKKIHHIPIVEYKKLVGLVSKADYLFFKRGFKNDSYDEMLEKIRLKNYKVKDIMTEKLVILGPDDEIASALEIFKENLFHAIPIVNKSDELVGILTTWDIIFHLAEDKMVTNAY